MKKGWVAAAVLILLSINADVRAQDTDPHSIRLTPDTTKIIHLEQDATSVIVANPDHASVVLDSPRLLVVMPRQPGTTLFTALNATGEVILEKNIIVSGTAKPQYVRIRRACGPGDAGCTANSYYYCPDGCYEVTPVGAKQGGASAPPFASSGGGGNGEYEDINAQPLPQADDTAPVSEAPPPDEPGSAPQVDPPSDTRIE